MIVDCHTHLWTGVEQLGAAGPTWVARQSGLDTLAAGPSDHAAAADFVHKTLVMGFRSAYLGASVSNDAIAEYVTRHGQIMIGIAAIDPMERDALATAERMLERSEFRGVTISPALQNFHPADSRAMALYELCSRRGAPVFFYQGTHFPTMGRMEYARPHLLDEIAREFPSLTIVLSSLGQPWIEEGVALVGKHARVFADVAGLIRRPWLAYNALVTAYQYNVMDKVLFGSDFPFFTAAKAIESIYRMHEMTAGTNLPNVPREVLRTMVERDSLSLLGISRPGDAPVTAEVDEDEEI